MKKIKYLLMVVLVLFMIILFGCPSEKASVKKNIAAELDLLKSFNTEAARNVLSWKELFPTTPENTEHSEKINEVFALFFQNFDYKILDIQINRDNHTATASLRLSVIDAKSLVRDFALAKLAEEIRRSAQNEQADRINAVLSAEEHYLILHRLLKENEYALSEIHTDIQLQKDPQNENSWQIIRTAALENDLSGSLLTLLSDTRILAPKDALSVYLDSITTMTTEEMSNYLGIESIMNTSDPLKSNIASALAEQVQKHFRYKIHDCAAEESSATAKTTITTFNSTAIMEDYQNRLEDYLADPEAVIEGETARYQKSGELLLESIRTNTETIQIPANFTLIHDGRSWKLDDSQHDLGNAIFGNFTSSPVQE